MLMSAAGCVEAGLTFASVHDSYWTHACDVEVMNEVLRKQFITLHSKHIMKSLESEFMERYSDYVYPVSLKIANPDEPVGEGMISWDDERIRRRNAKMAGGADVDGALSDPEVFEGESESDKSRNSSTQDNVFQFGEDEDDEHDLSSVTIEESEEDLQAEAKALNKARRRGKKTLHKSFNSWEPISFPPLPDRGDFDVQKVAESDYFFS